MCSGLTAFSALKRVKEHVLTPEDVMIVGLGGLGFQAVGFARALFGGFPSVADIDENKLKEARSRGCRAYNSKSDEVVADVRKGSIDGTGVGGVIDFVGSTQTQEFAESVLRKGGKSVVVGLFGGMMKRPLVMLPFRARKLEGAWVGSFGDAKEMMDVLRKSPIEPPPHHFRSIMSANESLCDLKRGKVLGRCVFVHDWTESRV